MHLRRKNLVIAIDGPAAAGKSTTAKLVAKELGYVHVDSGAMYRAVTLEVLRRGIDLESKDQITRVAEEVVIELRTTDGSLTIFLDGEDVTHEIRTVEVTNAVSKVSSIKEVRSAMVRRQRKAGEEGGVVMDGRDIGTVVFPNADLKIYMVATIEERARRRTEELNAKGVQANRESLEKEIAERDRFDSTRNESPLSKARDAIEMDTSNMSIDEQVEFIVGKAKERSNAISGSAPL